MQTRFYPVLPSSVWPFLQKSVDDWTSCSNTFRYLGTRSIRLFFMMVPWTGNCARQTDTDTVDKKRFATILFRSCPLYLLLKRYFMTKYQKLVAYANTPILVEG